MKMLKCIVAFIKICTVDRMLVNIHVNAIKFSRLYYNIECMKWDDSVESKLNIPTLNEGVRVAKPPKLWKFWKFLSKSIQFMIFWQILRNFSFFLLSSLSLPLCIILVLQKKFGGGGGEGSNPKIKVYWLRHCLSIRIGPTFWYNQIWLLLKFIRATLKPYSIRQEISIILFALYFCNY